MVDGKGSILYSESAAGLSFLDRTNFTVLASDDRAPGSSDLEIDFGGNITWSDDSGLRCAAGYNLNLPTPYSVLGGIALSAVIPDSTALPCADIAIS